MQTTTTQPLLYINIIMTAANATKSTTIPYTTQRHTKSSRHDRYYVGYQLQWHHVLSHKCHGIYNPITWGFVEQHFFHTNNKEPINIGKHIGLYVVYD